MSDAVKKAVCKWEIDYLNDIYDPSREAKPTRKYPRLCNNWMPGSWALDTDYNGMDLSVEIPRALSKWDIVKTTLYNYLYSNMLLFSQSHQRIRNFNPDITMLMYWPGGCFPYGTAGYYGSDIHDKLDTEGWWALKTDGSRWTDGPGGWTYVNYWKYPEAATWMADFCVSAMYDHNYWDGIWWDLMFSDELLQVKIGSNVDLDEDGVGDISQIGLAAVVNRVQEGYVNLFNATRTAFQTYFGENKIVVGNAGRAWRIGGGYDDSELFASSHGNMQEGFSGGLDVTLDRGTLGAIVNEQNALGDPERVFILHSRHIDPDTLRDRDDMRYGLCASLMTPAYYVYDAAYTKWATNFHHNQIWWWPEYNINLGSPLGNYSEIVEGEERYLRYFSNGAAVVNREDDSVEVSLNGRYRNFITNEIATSFTCESKDGLLLIRKPSRLIRAYQVG